MTVSVNLLFVDDSVMNQAMIKEFLKNTDFNLTFVSSGDEAVNAIELNHYDLVFLDYLMPGETGNEIVARIRANDRTSANADNIVVMTADESIAVEERFIAEGFKDYLKKPLKRSELISTIDRFTPAGFVINKSVGLEYCGGDERILREVMKAFIETDFVGKLTNDFETKNWKNYRIDVHGLKSGAKSIGAMHLSEHARDLEFALKYGDNSDYIVKHHSDLIKETLDMYVQINNF